MAESPLARLKHAIGEAGLFLALLGIHKLLDLALNYAFPEFQRPIHGVRLLVFCAFLLGYLNQTVEIAFALAPWSRSILRGLGARLGAWAAQQSPQADPKSQTPEEHDASGS